MFSSSGSSFSSFLITDFSRSLLYPASRMATGGGATPGFRGDTKRCILYSIVWIMPSISLSAVLNPEDSGGYVALCPELDIASQGESIDDAIQNLKEAVEGFFEVASRAEIETRLKGPALFTHFEVTRA